MVPYPGVAEEPKCKSIVMRPVTSANPLTRGYDRMIFLDAVAPMLHHAPSASTSAPGFTSVPTSMRVSPHEATIQ